MQPEVTLTLYDEAGRARRVPVEGRRFTIGRLLENDLAIEDANLSLRHAVIEHVDGAVLISDCGSEQGTQVNGEHVTGVVELHDGDVVTLGGVREMTVQLRAAANDSPNEGATTTPDLSQTVAGRSTVKRTNGAYFFAAMAVALVLLALGLLVAVFKSQGGNSAAVPAPVDGAAAAPEQAGTNTVNNAGVSADGLEEIERYALRVLRGSSDDPNPTLSHEALAEIRAQVESYRGSVRLQNNLRLMQPRELAQLAAAARRHDLKLPLVVLAALAQADRDERADPVAVAQEMLPALVNLRGIFGTELANDSLLVVAAYGAGRGGATPLQTAIFELTKRQPDSPAAIRSVWYLHDHTRLGAKSYDLVLRFLAVGIIAQDPRRFGVNAEPLLFEPSN